MEGIRLKMLKTTLVVFKYFLGCRMDFGTLRVKVKILGY
jgi:hypothetical protein